MGVSLYPAISRCLKARLYGWLPLSNAYGISLVKMRIKSGCLSAFHPLKALRVMLNLKFRSIEAGICNAISNEHPTYF